MELCESISAKFYKQININTKSRFLLFKRKIGIYFFIFK